VSLFFVADTVDEKAIYALRACDICFAGDIAFGSDIFPAGRFMWILFRRICFSQAAGDHVEANDAFILDICKNTKR